MKRLREILEKFLFYYIPHNGVYQPAHIDQAIKEIQELCEPMSREDIEKIVATKLRTTPIAGDFDRTRCIYANEAVIQSLIDELVGKLSTPRLTDKVYIGISKCCDAPAWFTDKNASGNPISVCDKCEKVCNMYKPNKPRLMEECPECAKLRGKIALLMSERPDMILENAKLRKKIDDLYEMGKKDCCTGKKPSEGVNK